jgi:hypothetical protein
MHLSCATGDRRPKTAALVLRLSSIPQACQMFAWYNPLNLFLSSAAALARRFTI